MTSYSKELFDKLCRNRPDSKLFFAISDTPEYRVWLGMRRRCSYGTASPAVVRAYRKRGIKVCARWFSSFEAFFQDMGYRPKGTVLARRDTTKDYTPSNCLWSTAHGRAQNSRKTVIPDAKIAEIIRRAEAGETHTALAKEYGVARVTITNIVAGRRRRGAIEGD